MVTKSEQRRKQQDAPGALETVRAFVNTRDLELGTDEVSDAGRLRDWLRARDLLDGTTAVSDGEWRRAVEVREALRALARHNTGQAADPDASETLDRLSRDAGVRLRYAPDGTSALAPRPGGGVLEALGRILAIVGTSTLDGTWRRFKVCPAEDCLWAFYDHSRNRSGTWCQMSECGNRAKARTYRRRHTS
ncbi:CGNR zinc finger domain-containing protein [Actinomadura viridis]|uniref:RNA-binding Zn ribbon-like protein n=1 Tax=Actinomadura viridis TaxID=58110 RepID=A0A931DJ60_9ACTN|nr:CGNR zinc finger domain-containing protein [Actinomadura viridis]MBG6089127.1 putative RNA-binding Zn ribbon-like protein [Actinomadura viridis]